MFSYDPTQINDGSLNEARFMLGDVFVETPEKDSFLSDEEILAALAGASTFKRGVLRLVESLLMRFAYEVDTKIHEAEWKLSDRFDAWKKLRDALKKELEQSGVAPQFGFSGKKYPAPFFTRNMHDF